MQNKSNEDAMETIRMTGPGMLTRTISEYLYSKKNKNNELIEKVNIEKNVTENNRYTMMIFPYTVFNPIPNTYTVDLDNADMIGELKRKFLVKNETNCENKNGRDDTVEGSDGHDEVIVEVTNKANDEKNSHVDTRLNIEYSSDNTEVTCRCKYSASAAIHWWQRSWQSKGSKECSPP